MCSTVELALLMGVWVSQLENMSMGDLDMTVICHIGEWARGRCSSTPHHLRPMGELALRS